MIIITMLKKEKMKKVKNYINALNYAIYKLNKLTISNNLYKKEIQKY